MPYTPIKDIAGANSAIADLYGRVDAAMKALAQGTADWGSILGKPGTFPPSTHTHSYLPLAGGTLTSELRVKNTGTHNAMVANSGVAGEFLFGGSIADGGSISPYIRVGTKKLLYYDNDPVAPTQHVIWHSGNYNSETGAALNPVFYDGGQNANTVIAPFSLCNSNIPSGIGSFAYTQTMCYPNLTSPTAKLQMAFSYSPTSRQFIRNYHGGAWNGWSELWHSGNFTPTNVPIQTNSFIIQHATETRIMAIRVGTTDVGMQASTSTFYLWDWENNRSILSYDKTADTVYIRAGVQLGNGAYSGGHLTLGTYHLWISSGKLYIKNGAPTSATDGVVVGTQT